MEGMKQGFLHAHLNKPQFQWVITQRYQPKLVIVTLICTIIYSYQINLLRLTNGPNHNYTSSKQDEDGMPRKSTSKLDSKNKSAIFDDSNDHSYYCPYENVAEKRKWRGHFLKSPSNNTQDYFIPTREEDTPINVAPMIPKAFLIEEIDYCSSRPHLKAIAYVHSAVNNVERRRVTRQTWGSASKDLGVVFVMGIAKNKEEEDIISSESNLHHDIVQGNYTDTYQFLTYKKLNGLYWITVHCSQVQWVVHADDDSLLDVTKYLTFMESYQGTYSELRIFCHLVCSSPPFRFKENPFVKAPIKPRPDHYSSEKEYPYSLFPIFCWGNIWFTSMEVAKLLIDSVPLVKYLSLDDVYVTGLLAEKAGVIRHMTGTPTSFLPEEIGKWFGWIQLGNERITFWNQIVDFYSNRSLSS